MPLLALFDVDGTLFLTDDPLSSEALLATLRDVYAVNPPEDAVEQVDHRGQTAKRIARLVLNDEGIDDAAVDERLDECCRRFAARYVTVLAAADTSAWRAAPGADEALTRLQAAGVRLALLTGNPEPMARARMFRLGLERFFPEGQGAFGCESESRIELIELARRRADGWPAEQTVELGDTRRDETTALAAGIRALHVEAGDLTAAVERLLTPSA
jgi:phosphoglycolate phosphatase